MQKVVRPAGCVPFCSARQIIEATFAPSSKKNFNLTSNKNNTTMKLNNENIKSIINLVCTILSAIAAAICTSACGGAFV